MSGFITTMFVPPNSHATSHCSLSCRPLNLKPEPLQPISTFVHGQSCMKSEMLVQNYLERERSSPPQVHADVDILNAFPIPPAPPAPAQPQTAHTSPLQRIGEKLREQHIVAAVQALACHGTMATCQMAVPSNPATLLPSAHLRSGDHVYSRQTPCPDHPNFSYKLVPEGQTSPIGHEASRSSLSNSDQGSGGCGGSGAILITAAGAREAKHRNLLSQATSLLFPRFSNPRTQRAPFKPQKSSRGTSSWQLKQYAEATLGSGSLRKAVKLPDGEDKDEWLAVNGWYFL